MMLRFLTRLGLFVLPLLSIPVILFLAPYPKGFRYAYIDKDCGKGGWLHERIFDNPAPIDIAFVGTSRAMQGVLDSLLSRELNLNVTNLAFCRPGRNFDYLIVKDLLEHKKPRMIVLDVRESEHPYSHLDFPYLAEANEVLLPKMVVNVRFFADILSALESRLLYWRERLITGLTTIEHSSASSRLFAMKDDEIVADINELSEALRSWPQRVRYYRPAEQRSWFYRLTHINYPSSYLRLIATLCEQHGTRLVFLYLKGFASPIQKPVNARLYGQLGTTLTPPNSLTERPELWLDASHLNRQGAEALHPWLSDRLRILLQGDSLSVNTP